MSLHRTHKMKKNMKDFMKMKVNGFHVSIYIPATLKGMHQWWSGMASLSFVIFGGTECIEWRENTFLEHNKKEEQEKHVKWKD